MLSENRKKFDKISAKFGEIFSKSGISPNTFTIISLLFALFSLVFLIKRNLIPATLFFIFAAFLDLIDGAVAKFTNRATKKGAYFDTIFDRYVEAIILLGFLFLPLPRIYIDAKFWIFLSLFGSLMTTYTKAAGKEKDILKEEFKKGLLERPERLCLIILSLILGVFNFSWMVYPIIFLAIFSNFTAIQRIYSVIAISQ
jgi:phosphatidylglycerophosphate synthase